MGRLNPIHKPESAMRNEDPNDQEHRPSDASSSSKDQESLIKNGLAWAPAIQHPLDRMYLKKIDRIPLMPRIMGWVVDSQRREIEALLAGDGVLVTASSCPEADTAFQEACEALDLDRSQFRFFVMSDPTVNAFTTGSGIPTVVATSALVNACSKNELKVVVGHELGHYICGHVRCHSLARFLNAGLGVAGFWLTPAWIAAKTISPLLLSWSRYSEISADRAGLLSGNDFEAACGVFLKLGGFPYLKGLPTKPSEVLMDQHIDYVRQTGEFSVLRRLWREVKHGLGATHPRVVERFAALDEWRDLGCYDELADASPEERIRIANEIGTDFLQNELDLALVEAAADYIGNVGTVSRKQALPLLRKAFLHGGTFRGTALERLVYAELAVSKENGDSLSYNLALVFADGGAARKVSVPVGYSPDWDFAPDAIRAEFIKSRRPTLSIAVYEPKA